MVQPSLLFTNKTPKDGVFWENFEVFLLNDYRGDWKNQVLKNVQRYVGYFEKGDLSILKTFTDHKRLSIMKSLAAYAKFSGCYEYFRHLIKQFGLKWSTNNDDVIIARLLKYSANNASGGIPTELFDWIQNVRVKVPALDVFMDFIIETGLRLDEAINSYSLIIKLSEKGELASYYNAEREVLEHFRFKEIFIRRTKKAFMSFASNRLIDSIQSNGLLLTEDVVKKRVQRQKLRMKFSDLRELYASCSIKYLRQPEIDFLQGRVSASVFMQNYFNPQFIADLHERALENSMELLTLTKERKQPTQVLEQKNPRCHSGCQKLVSEAELPELLAEGWLVVTVLPSGKIVVNNG